MSPKYFNHAAPDCEKRTTMTTPNIRDPLNSLPLEIRWKIYRLILYSPHLIKFKLGLEYKAGRTSSELGLSDCDTIIHPLASTCGPIRDEIKSWIRKEMVVQGEPHTLHNSIAMDLFNQRGKNLKIYGMLRERGGFCITLWDRGDALNLRDEHGMKTLLRIIDTTTLWRDQWRQDIQTRRRRWEIEQNILEHQGPFRSTGDIESAPNKMPFSSFRHLLVSSLITEYDAIFCEEKNWCYMCGVRSFPDSIGEHGVFSPS
ncbi:uncharacterized protein RSE6_09915 [Rhynchosporium secalis]|uniref:Uncharacterized protein n=1 Tax=Rhynchosporium secalis TaxID=38038 RepID=A0A1E1MJ39_RHYSE|nr:uncharacterized protein RSE6_09915 [Rhynchosporium secalis]